MAQPERGLSQPNRKLRHVRELRGWSQADVAAKVATTKFTVSRWELGTQSPSPFYRQKLCDLFQMNAEELGLIKEALIPLLESFTDLEQMNRSDQAPLVPIPQPVAALPVSADSSPPPLLELPVGTVTFLLTEIEESAMQWEQDTQTANMAFVRYGAILRDVVTIHRGTIFKAVGDTMYAVFANASDALQVALAAQRTFQAEQQGSFAALRVRVALYTGFIEIRDGDYVGSTLKHATRLLHAGHGGQILLSLVTGGLVQRVLSPDISLRDLGEYYLTDLLCPERVLQLVAPDLPGDFPLLYVRTNQLHNLPAQLTPLIGRDKEMSDALALLHDTNVRLVTICGPGGIGKTRLALQVAEAQLEAFPQGVYFVSLAPVSSTDFLVPAIASAIQFLLYGAGNPRTQLLHYLQGKKLLLVLDNFEHLLSDIELVVDILQRVPQVVILLTSRERLNLQGESVIELSGLTFPAAMDGVHNEAYGAVQLFLEGARRARTGLMVPLGELPDVVHICQLVEGMPLALELAASWMRMLSCKEIADEITKSLMFLSTTSRGVENRHRSMSAVFDHSWSLLSSDEKRVFRQLSVFRGGITREAAELVVGASLTHLAALVDKSLLRRSVERRYDMHELARQYAAMKLQEAVGEYTAVSNRHCSYYTEFLYQRNERLRGRRLLEALEEIRSEIENVRIAWRWAVAHRMVKEIRQSLQSLLDFYDIQGQFYEGREAFRLAAEELQSHGWKNEQLETRHGLVLGQILAAQGWLCFASGRYEETNTVLQHSLNLLRRLEAREELINPLTTLGMVAFAMGNYQEAQRLLRESLVVQRSTGDRWGEGWAQGNLGMVSHALGQYQEAYALIHQALTLCTEIGNQRLISLGSSFLSVTACALGRYAEGRTLSEESLRLSQELNHYWGMAVALSCLSMATYYEGKYSEAQQFLLQSLELFRSIEEPWGIATTLSKMAVGACALGAYDIARPCAIEALQVAIPSCLAPVALDVLVVMATIRVKEEKIAAALELLGLPLLHSASSYETRERARLLLAELEPYSPSPSLAAIKEQWSTQTLEVVAEKILQAEQGREENL